MKKYFNKPWKVTAWIILLYLVSSFILGEIFKILASSVPDAYLDYILLAGDLLLIAIASFEVGKTYIRFTKKKMLKKMIIWATAYLAFIYALKFVLVESFSGTGFDSADFFSLIAFTIIYTAVAYFALSLSQKK
jgi:uncharacterized membrane protein